MHIDDFSVSRSRFRTSPRCHSTRSSPGRATACRRSVQNPRVRVPSPMLPRGHLRKEPFSNGVDAPAMMSRYLAQIRPFSWSSRRVCLSVSGESRWVCRCAMTYFFIAKSMTIAALVPPKGLPDDTRWLSASRSVSCRSQ
jgi:hypothetical protein